MLPNKYWGEFNVMLNKNDPHLRTQTSAILFLKRERKKAYIIAFISTQVRV
jgi:hypothetical protein